uniref:C2H2-type domain-containing protein n=1 Tax=Ananas comosus var. bracteatus TaxID=296719 RepID=A0A6V7PJ09_ANACO|nr:unnamed protein product [Ananas comosus var. bracteatus]
MSAPHPPLLPHHPSTFSAVGGGGDGGDDPAKNRPRKSSHEADAAAAVGNEDDENEEGEEAAPPKQQQQQRRRRRIPEGPLQCPVCGRTFKSAKALHGHMRCHPERNWRGVTPPTTAITVRLGEKEAAADSLMLLSAQPQDQAEEEGAGSVSKSRDKGTTTITTKTKQSITISNDMGALSKLWYLIPSHMLFLGLQFLYKKLKIPPSSAAVAATRHSLVA